MKFDDFELNQQAQFLCAVCGEDVNIVFDYACAGTGIRHSTCTAPEVHHEPRPSYADSNRFKRR